MANYKGHFQQRHGTYADFESHKTELLRAEMAIVESGDPNTTEGAAVYFKPGNSEPVRLANASEIVKGGKGDPGEDGFSPIATVTKSGTQATITITDKNGTTTVVVNDGEKGDTGATGAPGAKGDPGEDGFSPQLSVERGTGGYVVTIISKESSPPSQIFIPDGAPGDTGPQGPKGDKGDTPTAEEIRAAIDLSDYAQKTDLESVDKKLNSIYSKTQNCFNLDTDIILGINNTGSSVSTRAMTVPIYTGDGSSVVSVKSLPSNLKYKVYAYPGETYDSPTDYTYSYWISQNGESTVVNNTNKRYIRVMFGTVNNATITSEDFDGLEMQIESGSQKTNYIPYSTAVDFVARNTVYPVHLKICSYNVGMYSYGIAADTPPSDAMDNLSAFLEENNFDLIAIQEGRTNVNGVNVNDNVYNDFFISQLNLLNNCAIKSQFILTDTGEGVFTAGSRKYVYGTAIIGNKQVFIINVHLGLTASDRTSNYTELLALLKQHEYFIAFGDFNAAIDYNTGIDEQTQAEYDQLINAGYTVANGGRWGLLNTMGTSSKHPDNICVSSNIKMITAKTADVYATMNSDHVPVIVDLVV